MSPTYPTEMHLMKRHILFALIASMVASGSAMLAQNVTPRNNQGDQALLFSIKGFGDFGVGSIAIDSLPSPTGGTELNFSPVAGAGYRSFLSDRFALRVLVGLSVTSDDPNDSTKAKRSSTTIAISPGIEMHMINAGPVSGYIGAAVKFATASDKSTSTAGSQSVESTSSGTLFGAGIMIGAEFFPWSNVSLGAEYMLSFNSASTSSKLVVGTNTTESDGPSRTQIGIGSGGVIVSVYF